VGVSGEVVLHGGTGIRTDPDRLLAFARQLDLLGRLVEHELLGRLAGLGVAPALLPAAAVDPAGAAQVLALTAGCLALAAGVLAGCHALATALRAAAAGYAEADRLDRRVLPVLRAVRQVPAALGALRHGEFQRALTADPYLADAGLDWLALCGGTLLGPRGVLPGPTPGEIAGRVAPLYRDGRPRVTSRPGLPTLDARGAPRSAGDLLAGLALRERQDAGGGAIDVRLLDGPGGRRAIVDITGTTDWNLDPLRVGGQATDLGTNLRALAGHPSVMSRGVTEALRRAGVRPDEPVMLVGHSQGGMVAAQLATELTRTGEFRVSQVVTAGSPVGLAAVPRSVSVLSLENRGDVVPELDGADNPRTPSWLTAQVSRGGAGVGGRHAVTAYQAAARDLDADRDPALARWRAGARGFLRARTVHTLVFQVRRD